MKLIFQKIKNIKLEVIIFSSGAVVMILEIVGSRVLAPYLGNSIFIWSSLIGVVLGSLSIGYLIGGMLSDKGASLKTLSNILLYSSISIFLLNLLKGPILSSVSTLMGIRQASVLLSIILFSPSSVLLGMVSPYVIKLKLKDLKTSGETVGFFYALSTMGSIVGTFLAGFILISYIGTDRILILLSIVLLLLSIFSYPSFKYKGKIAFLLLLFFSIYLHGLRREVVIAQVYVDKDTNYSRVIIYESVHSTTGRPVRNMILDKQPSSAMFLDGDDLVYEYTKYYNLAEHFKPDLKNTLMLGGAAYSYPKEFLRRYPNAKIDVVEIDPELTTLAKKYFNLKDDLNLRIIHQDGRDYLNKNEKKYDVIYGDAFSSIYTIPYHLTTVEFIERIYSSLVDDGVYIINIISSISGDKSDFFKAQYRTLSEVFPQVFVYRVKDKASSEIQNLMLVALKSDKNYPKESQNQEINSYLEKALDYRDKSEGIILTDDFAPVEHFAWKMLSF